MKDATLREMEDAYQAAKLREPQGQGNVEPRDSRESAGSGEQ